jgi:ribose 1,5-bisphosphate isomerase
LSSQRVITEVLDRIRSKEFRGPTRVTQAALKALSEASQLSRSSSPKEFVEEQAAFGELLIKTRPTAILLANGVRQVIDAVRKGAEQQPGVPVLQQIVLNTVDSFLAEIERSVDKIGEIGARRLRSGDTVLCYGHSTSVLSIVQKAQEQGKNPKVIVSEARPELEGLSMAKELLEIKVPTTMIIDSAVSYFMKDVDRVLTGADAVSANGAVINKIGTSTVAAIAHLSRVNVFVAASVHKFSPETILGELVEIEELDPSLVISREMMTQYKNMNIRNPAFDVTPPEHIDLIVTERGVIPPQGAIMILRQQEAGLLGTGIGGS